MEGLWVRLRFRDNETIEGMMPNDLLLEDNDFPFIPPDTRSNTQRILSRSALAEMTVIGVIGDKKSQRRSSRPEDTRQVTLFR